MCLCYSEVKRLRLVVVGGDYLCPPSEPPPPESGRAGISAQWWAILRHTGQNTQAGKLCHRGASDSRSSQMWRTESLPQLIF